MLTEQQQEYLQLLHREHPDIQDDALVSMLIALGWDMSHAQFGLQLYHSIVSSQPAISDSHIPSEISAVPPAPGYTPGGILSGSIEGKTEGERLLGGGRGLKVLIVGILAFFAVGASVAYALRQDTKLYTPENIISGIYAKLQLAKTFEYRISVEVSANPRSPDASPFQSSVPVPPEVLKKYQRDQDRLRDLQSIQTKLKSDFSKKKESLNSIGLSASQIAYITSLKKDFPGRSDSEIKDILERGNWNLAMIDEGILRYQGKYIPGKK